MPFDPETHHRRSLRLPAYDYSQPGLYILTICTHERRHLLGEVVECKMHLNEFGKIVESCWARLADRRGPARLDVLVVMPNHVHALVEIPGFVGKFSRSAVAGIREPPVRERLSGPTVGAIHESPLQARRGMTLSKIVGRFKMVTAKRINQIRSTPRVPVWQRNYYEHIVRDNQELEFIRDYIETNPARWNTDPENS